MYQPPLSGPPGMGGTGYQQYDKSPQVYQPNEGYQQYGAENMVSYPTSHLYQHTGAPPAPPMSPPGISDPVTKAVVDNILGKLPTKKNQVMHRCDVCDQEFSGRSVLDTHLAGAKHAKKLKSMEILNKLAASGQNFSQTGPGGNLRCEACGIDANSSQQLQTHLAGNKHKQKMLKLGGKMPEPSCVEESPPSDPQQVAQVSICPIPSCDADPSESLSCSFCKVTFNSTLQMQQHMESRKHKEKESPKQHSSKHHPYRRVGQARFSQPRAGKKKKQPLAFLTPLSSSFVQSSTML